MTTDTLAETSAPFPPELYRTIITVSLFFIAAYELMLLNDRLTATPAVMPLRSWLFLTYALHLTCIALATACWGLRARATRRLRLVTTIFFGISIFTSGMILISLAVIEPVEMEESPLEGPIDATPKTTIRFVY